MKKLSTTAMMIIPIICFGIFFLMLSTIVGTAGFGRWYGYVSSFLLISCAILSSVTLAYNIKNIKVDKTKGIVGTVFSGLVMFFGYIVGLNILAALLSSIH